MIVSYSRNFIFIKTKKTGGTTVEALMAAACGPNDVLTLKAQGRERVNAGKFYPHISAEGIRSQIDRWFWKSAFKFTIERHPYEKAVSQAFYRFPKKNYSTEDMANFLDRTVRTGDYPGFYRWSIEGRVVVDEILRQESLWFDIRRVGERLGIPIPEELPHMKAKLRVDRRPARDILSDEQKGIVFERCREEFETLGYEP